ncbi:glycosyltransferase family 2 protein [Candidatus Pacearchaeota archaeon]|nr:glycosyltransferase family 2 protein [Candidatus Pacearchaeota archaeon]
MVKTLSCIIPAYNEHKTLPTIIHTLASLSLPRIDIELLLIDDGSTDATPQITRALQQNYPQLRVYRHAVNQGKGASLRTGIAHAKGDFLLFQDADLEYTPNDIPRLVAFLIETNGEVVYGSRFNSVNHFNSFLQFFGNRFLTFLTNLLYGSRLTDMETGYKLLRRSALRGITLREKGFGIEPELTAQLLVHHRRILEFPISYRARTKGKKLHYLRDGLRAVWILFLGRIKGRKRIK